MLGERGEVGVGHLAMPDDAGERCGVEADLVCPEHMLGKRLHLSHGRFR
ncbi:hypothetical protein [Candidatus Poriferisodalis sp.]